MGLVGALVQAGCSSPVDHPPGPAPPRFDTYVALGDSYSAAPLVPVTELANGCFRSDHNYPHLLAGRLEVETLRDVTCSAADTGDLDGWQTTLAGARVPPQLRPLSDRTDLVTVGIGGNDLNLFASLVNRRQVIDAPDATIRRIGIRVGRVLLEVHQRAPHARVVLVGYPRLVDPGTSCPRRLPFGPAELRAAYRLQVRLEAALRRAADTTDTTFVDLFAASEGHGICATQPWVNGQRNDRRRAAPYHPFAVEMRAAADAVESAITR